MSLQLKVLRQIPRGGDEVCTLVQQNIFGTSVVVGKTVSYLSFKSLESKVPVYRFSVSILSVGHKDCDLVKETRYLSGEVPGVTTPPLLEDQGSSQGAVDLGPPLQNETRLDPYTHPTPWFFGSSPRV